MRSKLIVLIVVLFGGIFRVQAQQTTYSLTLDTNYIMIGDQIHLTLKVKTKPGIKVLFPPLKDTVVRGIEIISGPLRDSARERDGQILIQERYVVTAFDSGMYVIPSMPIKVEGTGYNNVLRTDPVALVVNTYVVDQQKGNYDIVMPIATPWSFAELLPYLLWILGGCIILVLIILLIIRLRSQKPLFAKEEPVIPPYELAMRALNDIKEEKLWQQGHTKAYYTQLTDVIRVYLAGELNVPAMEQTSFEILRALEGCSDVDTKQREKLAMMFETSDFVKFAKAEPLPDENTRSLTIAFDFVNETHERVVERVKEQAEQEALEQKKREVLHEKPGDEVKN